MPLFSTKPKLNVEECCKQFYDSAIFRANHLNQDVWSTILVTYFNHIAEADQSFLSVASEMFRNEMTALRIEMFGLAWSGKYKQEDLSISQSIFTRRYLEENGRLDIWNIMGEYNYVIAYSASADGNGEQIGGVQAEKLNSQRTSVINKWWNEANIVDEDNMTQEEKDKLVCVVRVANRIGADIWREDRGVNITLGLLSGMLARRLEYDENTKSEASIRLGSVILSFHSGAEEFLKSIELGK